MFRKITKCISIGIGFVFVFLSGLAVSSAQAKGNIFEVPDPTVPSTGGVVDVYVHLPDQGPFVFRVHYTDYINCVDDVNDQGCQVLNDFWWGYVQIPGDVISWITDDDRQLWEFYFNGLLVGSFKITIVGADFYNYTTYKIRFHVVVDGTSLPGNNRGKTHASQEPKQSSVVVIPNPNACDQKLGVYVFLQNPANPNDWPSYTLEDFAGIFVYKPLLGTATAELAAHVAREDIEKLGGSLSGAPNQNVNLVETKTVIISQLADQQNRLVFQVNEIPWVPGDVTQDVCIFEVGANGGLLLGYWF